VIIDETSARTLELNFAQIAANDSVLSPHSRDHISGETHGIRHCKRIHSRWGRNLLSRAGIS
jgi:hypothetical protein